MVEVVKVAYITRAWGDDDFIFIFILRVDFYIKFCVFPSVLFFFPPFLLGSSACSFRVARGFSLRVEERWYVKP